MKIYCEIFIDGKRLDGYLIADGEYIFLYKKKLFFKGKPIIRIPLKSIIDIEIKWRIFYIKAVIRITVGLYIKQIMLKGDKKLATFLGNLREILNAG